MFSFSGDKLLLSEIHRRDKDDIQMFNIQIYTLSDFVDGFISEPKKFMFDAASLKYLARRFRFRLIKWQCENKDSNWSNFQISGSQIAYFYYHSNIPAQCEFVEGQYKNYWSDVDFNCQDLYNNEFQNTTGWDSNTDYRIYKAPLVLKDGRQITMQPNSFACFEVDPYTYKAGKEFKVIGA